MPPSSAELQPRLIGRDWELSQLHAALRSAEGGRGALVLLVGEPGIGKTRLANDFAEGLAGAKATWGRAWEAGGAPAYWPWIEALRPFAGLTAHANDAERMRIAPLALLLPELEGVEAPKPAADPAQDRFRLFSAVSAFLSLAARDRPLVVILDDVHVADVSSLMLLHFVARNLHATRVVIVAAYRDVEARLSAEAGEALAKVAREGRYLALRRLEREEVASWAAAEGSAAEADTLFAATEGNPLFVSEMLRFARDRRVTGSGSNAGPLPDGVRDVIRARLALLSPSARSVLDAACVLGRAVDLEIVAKLVAQPLAAVRDLAAEAVRSNALVDTGDRTSFSHILIREVLYQDLTAARRGDLHAQVARALLDRHGADEEASLAEAVHHLFAAVPLVVPPDEAITWARKGAKRATRRLAFEEAAELLGRATDVHPAGRDVAKFDLLMELAAAQIGAGQATRGRGTALVAASIARRIDDSDRLARAALRYGSVFVIAQVDRVLLGLLDEALAALPTEDSPLRARLLARLGAALQPAEEPEHPITLAREAIAMSRRTCGDDADEATRLEVLVAGTSAMLFYGDPRERLPLDTELITLATRAGDRLAVLRGLLRLVFDQLELGDNASADRTIAEYDQISRAVDLPAFRWRAPIMRAMRLMMERKYDDAESLCEKAGAIAARVDDGNAIATLQMHAMARALARNQLDVLAKHLESMDKVLARSTDPVFRRSFRASMLTHLGRAEEAREDLEFLALHDPPYSGRPPFVWAADACLALGHQQAAVNIIAALQPLAHRRFTWSPFAMVTDGRPIALWIEKLKALVGSQEQPEAEQHIALALPLEPASFTPDRADTRRALAVEKFELVKEGDHWTIRADTTFHLRDSRGLAILAKLVESPKREFHATDLVAPGGEAAAGHNEDAGDVLDPKAIASYKRRLEDLREIEAEASKNNDTHRATRVRDEMDALSRELAQGVGLGGRSRKASSTAEKARINVRKRILDAISRIREHSPALAKHLERSIRTGIFCSYDP